MSKNMAVLDDNNKVINIIVCNDNEQETTNLIQYSDANPAYIGGNYVNGRFCAPQPYPSWSLDENFDWQAPTPRPDGLDWRWDEETLSWIEIEA